MKIYSFEDYKIKKVKGKYRIYYTDTAFKYLIKNYHPFVFHIFIHLLLKRLNDGKEEYIVEYNQRNDINAICAEHSSYENIEGLVRIRMILNFYEQMINFRPHDGEFCVFVSILKEYAEKYCSKPQNLITKSYSLGITTEQIIKAKKKYGL